MHADCTGVIVSNPIFAMAEAVDAESGGDSDDQELDMVGTLSYLSVSQQLFTISHNFL